MEEITLIYVAQVSGTRERPSSVQKKIIDQINGINNAGLNCVGWLFSTDVDKEEKISEKIIIKPLINNFPKWKLFGRYKRKQKQISYIHSELRNVGKGVSFFMRLMMPGKSFTKMIKDLGGRTYLYIPSDILWENYYEFREGLSGSVLSKLLKWYDYLRYSWWQDYYLYAFLTSKVKACVAFTPEFCETIRRRSWRQVVTIYNRDGANASMVKIRTCSIRNGPVKLLFMKGSNSVQRWAGLERLIESIEKKGNNRFELYITGRVLNPEAFKAPFIKLTGHLTDKELHDLVDTVDLGVSNLANYLIKFNETTNLKSRDYFMRGLPYIQANSMPDVDMSQLKTYYLRLPNNDSLLDMDAIFDYAMELRRKTDHPINIRSLAEGILDWNITTAELVKGIRAVEVVI